MSTRLLRRLGQSLWLDNISRPLLDSGTLKRFIDDCSITGITSNPTIFDEAIAGSDAYDRAIHELAARPVSDEELFTELALDDLRRAADLLRPEFDRTQGGDGWVSMEVSPLLVDDASGTVEAARRIFTRAERPNFFVKIPGVGTSGLTAIEETISRGIPVNVTLLFSREQYLAAADAYLRGIERRLREGNDPRVASVASVFVSRWDKAVHDTVRPDMRNRLGIAVAGVTYAAYRTLLASDRWRKLEDAGALPQKLLWASTGTKDPQAPDCLYVETLAAPDTINTLPEKTLRAFVDHGQVQGPMETDGASARARLDAFENAGVDAHALAARLQVEGVRSFAKSWHQLMDRIAAKRRSAIRGEVRSSA